MTDAAINLLVTTAQNLVTHYSGLISGRKEELHELTKELEQLQSLVADACQNRNTQSERFKVWLRQIRDVILDVEDTIAYCSTQAAAENFSSNWFYRVFNWKKVTLAEEVRNLRSTVVNALNYSREEMSRLPASVNATTSSSKRDFKRQRTKKKQSLEYIIPRVKEMEGLVKRLKDRSVEFEVLAIVGMAGLGKTTLAWKIYRDMVMEQKIPTVIWVNVSQDFNKNEVLLTILEKLEVEEDWSGRAVDELSDSVRKHLEREKFLVFFDDVWEISDWEEIADFLPIKSNKNGKVVMTTRNHRLAKFASTGAPHRLKLLDKDESWKLLHLSVFGDDVFPQDLIETGEKIAKKCDGLPFAIVVIGGVLSEIWRTTERIKEAKEEWETVLGSVERYLINGDGNKVKGLGQIISMSFKSLSPELQNCFLYLGIFPEDTEIPVWKLIQLWIVEGFILQEDGISLEKTAQKYVKELIHKNLLMVVKTKPGGNAKTCRVHDLIRNFCEKEASNLFQEIRFSRGKFVPGDEEIVKCRRICIHSSIEKFLERKPDIQKARSFLSFSKQSVVWGEKEKELPPMTASFKVLRVLDVNMAIMFHKFPDEITQLVLLKYVTLSGVHVNVLPKDIHKLWNVQTLEVYTSSPTLRINANIWKMKQLRHFKTKASIILSKGGKRQRGGVSLLTLNRLSPKSCNEKVFGKAENLISLGIRGELGILVDSNPGLEKLENLEKLKLVNGLSDQKPEEKPLLRLPPHDSFPPNVKILVLSGTYLGWEKFSTLDKLAELEELKLKDNAFKGDLWDATGCQFERLQSLLISKADIAFWRASRDNFPRLTDLILKDCKELKGLPEDLVNGLELLHMDTVSARAITAAKKIEKAILESDQGKINDKHRFKLVLVSPEDYSKEDFLQ